jgi:hypothetical protein
MTSTLQHTQRVGESDSKSARMWMFEAPVASPRSRWQTRAIHQSEQNDRDLRISSMETHYPIPLDRVLNAIWRAPDH